MDDTTTDKYPLTYSHTQRSPMWLLFLAISALQFGSIWILDVDAGTATVLGVVGVIMAFCATTFQTLTAEDADDRLVIRFGPNPLFRTSVKYDDIMDVEVGRSRIIDGWGIHYSLGSGWVWNIWGRDCVIVDRRHGRILIGTDDAEQLAAFLKNRIHEPTY